MHFEMEAKKLLSYAVNDLHVSINQIMKVISLVAYIKKWKQDLWETVFYK
jgi:hypothetical protein